MGWKDSDGFDVTSAFQGITTPPRELYDEIHGRGWEVTKVDVNGDGLYEATAKNPYGETVAKTGPDPNTALGHVLVGIMRQETMRYPKAAAWTATWENERPQIAQAYAEAPTYDPKAAGSWKELGEDSQRRAEAIAHQLHVEFTNDPYPYMSVNDMQDDIKNKQHVLISKANLAHPLWSTDQALAYRTVHDVLGHAAVGGDWGWHGENGATAAHMPLLSPNAQKALFTEAIGQAAHNSYYQQIAPQKVAFLDDHLAKIQERENSAGHSGVHPSQSLVPSGIPSIEPEEKTSSVANRIDPNDGWESGVEPLPDNAYLWQKEQSGKDPLDHQGLRDQQYALDRGWFNLQNHDGMPDMESQRQAVANAFRSVLLEPRQTPRWAATHYQHLMNVPPGTSDPIRYTDTLETQREAHNKARGLPEGIAHGEMAEGADALRHWVKGLDPKLDDTEVDEITRRELFHIIAEEEAQVTAEDPTGKLTPMQIKDTVNKNLKRRLAVLTKPSVDQKFDFGKDRLFHKSFNAPDPGVYGDFLYSHVRPIAGIGLHIDDLARAAREDVANHGGKGHHFRSKAVDLVPGVGPRQVSHAWYRLQPHTSQLGIIGPSVAESLGYDPEKELPTRDYFKAERQLATGRDAAGYGHVPLGSFSMGMHDNINYGHGVHRDLSPYATLRPTPYDQVDWTQYPNLATSKFEDPYWWKSTQPNRDEVGKDWDQIVATQYPAESIPFRTSSSAEEDARYYYIHSTDHQFQPGDTIEPAASIGHEAPWSGVSPGYDPNNVYMWDLNALNDPRSEYGIPQANSQYHYLVEPLGAVSPDPEKAGLEAEYDKEQDEDYRPEWYHDYYHVTPQARVIKPFDNWGGVLDAAGHMNKFGKTADYTNGDWQLPDTPQARGVMIPVVTHPDTGEEIEGDPGMSLMQHIKNSLGLHSTEDVWAQNPTAYKH